MKRARPCSKSLESSFFTALRLVNRLAVSWKEVDATKSDPQVGGLKKAGSELTFKRLKQKARP